MKAKLFIITILFTITFLGCKGIALLFTPSKKGIKQQTPLQVEANKFFWKHFHAGQYDSLPSMIRILTAAYIDNPHDPVTTAHLAFSHMWALSERSRQPVLQPGITDHAVLAKKYFAEAFYMKPDDARLHGFLASAYLAEGNIDADEEKKVEGYFMMKKAIRQWPEFNYFTGGYVMSQLPKESKQFREGLEWQWKNLDVCACETVDRQEIHYRKYMSQETREGKRRACWNSWIAPHNFEGFFLNMGDMLVKSGDWQRGIKAYENARLSKSFNDWAYKNVLEARIRDAKENVVYFNQKNLNDDRRVIMVNSSFSCMGCHKN